MEAVARTEFSVLGEKDLSRLIMTAGLGSPVYAYRVTPALARLLVKQIDPEQQRRLKKQKVRDLSKQIQQGHWHLNAETIKISDTGRVLDGQHRLQAVIHADRAVDVYVAFGLPDAYFGRIDRGIVRTAGDIFKIHGLKNYNKLAAAALFIWQYESGGTVQESACEPEDLYDFMAKRCAGLSDFLIGYEKLQFVGFRSLSKFAGINYLASENHPQEAESFFYMMATGNDIGSRDRSHPVNRLRQVFIEDFHTRHRHGRGLDGVTRAAFVVLAWNAFVEKRPLGKLQWGGLKRKSGIFPVIK